MLPIAACNKGSNETAKPPTTTEGQTSPVGQTPAVTESGKPTAKKEGKTTIVISAFTDDGWVAQAKRKYEALHSDVVIQIMPYMPSDSTVVSTNDFTKFFMVLNTELLSGKGPDIIDISYQSPGNWVNKGLLVNLSELMAADPDFNQSQLFENIVEASKSNGNLYVMPLSFQLRSLLVGDGDAIQKAGVRIDDDSWTWNDFIAAAEKLMGEKKYKYAFGGAPAELLLSLQIRADYKRWVDTAQRQAHFQSDAFIELLKQTKEMYDRQIAAPPEQLRGSEKPKMYFMNAGVFSFDSYLTVRSAYPNGKLYRMPHAPEERKGVAFAATDALAITANSSVIEEAWDFIKFALSEEMQYTPEIPAQYANFPINKIAYDRWMKDIRNAGKAGSIELMNGSKVKVTDQDIQDFESLIAKASTLFADDDKVLNMIYEEAPAYFEGQKSAEAVAKLIQNRVMTYLNE